MFRTFLLTAAVCAALFVCGFETRAQSDELRAATGLPIKIGEPAVFGQVTFKRLAPDDAKPLIYVSLLDGGTIVERVQANDAGWYVFRRSVRVMATLLFELNNNEIGRVVLSVGASPQIRQDFSIDWAEAKRLGLTGVVPATGSYNRSPEAAKSFDAAMKAIREKNFNAAAPILKGLIAKDPKDYVAWTELGTIYFKQDKLDDAEACYFKAIELKQDYLIALLNLGKLYVTKKQGDNAIVVLSNAVKVDPASADAQHYLGEGYLLVKKGSLAVTHLNEALKIAPNEKADIHLRLAALYDAAKLKDRASAEYKMFLAKRPDHPEKAQLEKYIADNPPK